MKCNDCVGEAVRNRTLCEKCLDRARNRESTKRQKYIALGVCGYCGKNKPECGKINCSECIQKYTIRDKARSEKRIKSNQCVRCARDKSLVKIWHNRYCAGCHLKYKFKWNGTKEEAELIINNLLEKQNYVCALTGRDLKSNKYHIDHIQPRSSRPDLLSDPNNWQLIVEEANVFKTNLTQQQVLKLAQDIVKYNLLKE